MPEPPKIMDSRIKVSKVENVTCWREGKRVEGSLHLTAHHLIFRYPRPPPEINPEAKPKHGESWLTYPMISYCTYRPAPQPSPHPPSIRLRCRDFTFMSFHFLTDQEARSVYDSIKSLTCKLGRIDKLYAFSYAPQGPEKQINGWKLYDTKREFARQGISPKSTSKGWRITNINANYEYSPTYPSVLVVPATISDSVLKYGAKYRSRARIPALTYLHPINNCSITRSSQPMRGTKGTRNPQDERLVAAICATNKHTTTALTVQSAPATPQSGSTTDLLTTLKKEESAATDSPYGSASETSFADVELLEDEALRKANELKDAQESVAQQDPDKAELKVYGAQQNNLIVDARPTINAIAMQVAGKGSENMDHYRCATKAYLGIENIHAMRDSLDAVINALKDSDISSLPLNHDQLARSGWVKHIANMLDGAGLIARTIGINHSHVLIHCSDGWDRTSQLSALSQLCLDPYFRTIDGFITLVEKDWLSFGHMFRHRAGPLSSEKWFEIENERVSGQVAENGAPVPSTGGNTFENALSKASGFFRKGDNKESSESDTEPHALDPSAKKVVTHKSITDEKLVTKTSEVSPMFHQFLDGTYQLLYQHPTRFEFNERFLKRLLYHLYSCQYGSFLFDNEKERLDAKAKERTHSVWNYFLSRRHEFTNPAFDPIIDDHVPGKERLIFPKKEDVRWWAEGFGRKDAEMNGVSGPQLTTQEIDAPVLTGVETAGGSLAVGGGSRTTTSRPASRVEQGTNALTNGLAALGIGAGGSRGSPSPSRPRTPGTKNPSAVAGVASRDRSPAPRPLFEQMEEMH